MSIQVVYTKVFVIQSAIFFKLLVFDSAFFPHWYNLLFLELVYGLN